MLEGHKDIIKNTWHFIRRDIEVKGLPLCVNVELTNSCTLDCIGCPRRIMTRSTGFMSEEVFNRAIDQIQAESITKFICLHHFGDSLLHPKLLEFASYARSRGMNSEVSTKGCILTEKLAQKLARSDLSLIKFSFYGTDEESFNRYQRNGDYKQTMRNIDQFLKMKHKPLVMIELLVSPATPKEGIEEFLKKWEGKVEYIGRKEMHGWIGDDKEINSFIGPVKEERKPCFSLWVGNLSILYNGDVVPCCQDYDGKYVLGNIMEEDLLSMWNNERMRKLRYLHLNGERHKIDLCRKCSQGHSFFGILKLGIKELLSIRNVEHIRWR